jgi:hypothetical protein
MACPTHVLFIPMIHLKELYSKIGRERQQIEEREKNLLAMLD